MDVEYRLEIRGPIPRTIVTELRRRFGDVAVRSDRDRTVLSNLMLDQAALRAVLGLLWDANSELRLVCATGDEDQGGTR